MLEHGAQFSAARTAAGADAGAGLVEDFVQGFRSIADALFNRLSIDVVASANDLGALFGFQKTSASCLLGPEQFLGHIAHDLIFDLFVRAADRGARRVHMPAAAQ